MKQSIPKSQPKIIDKNNPWWTPQLQQQRKTVSKLYRTATRFPSEIKTGTELPKNGMRKNVTRLETGHGQTSKKNLTQ